MSWALVLGGGGAPALAWHTGLLAGLRDGGADPTRPDLLVGTSAGALVGAQILTGRDPGELFDRQRGTAAHASTVRDGLLDGQPWPELPLLVTALDDESGALVVWTRASGVPLSIAVASSCPEPLSAGLTTIEGRRYRDAGPLSATSAQLAFGHRLVVVVAAPTDASAAADPLGDEVAQLRAGGSHVHVITPDPRITVLFRTDPFDAAHRADAAAAGYAQGGRLAAVVGGWLDARDTLVPDVDVEDLAARFAALALRKPEWTHAAHLAVGAWHVERYGATDTLTRLRDGIRRLNVSIGGENSASAGYHETITAAYVTLLASFLESCPSGLPLATKVAQLLTSPLAGRDMLFTFYSRARLLSPDARARWVDPDLAPLRLDAVVGRPEAAGAGEA